MARAIENAKNFGADIPVCAMVVKNNEIIAIQTNKREKENDISAHAEILALKEASKKVGNWRLNGCDLYVTLEPCPMCAWAILNSRIENLYFGSYDIKYGAFGSKINLQNISDTKIKVFGGIMEQECNLILNDYFSELRK